MTLRDAVSAMVAQPRPIIVPAALPETSMTASCEAEITKTFGLSGALREPPDLDEIQNRLIECLKHGRGSEISRRDLRYAPQCIWYENNPIADRDVHLQQLLRILEVCGRRSLTRTLAAVYFRYFSRSKPGIESVGRALSRMVNENLRELYRLNEDFHVFDPAKGPVGVAHDCLRRDTTSHNSLQGRGINGGALTSGFGVCVFQEGMAEIAKRLEQDVSLQLIERAVRWTDAPKPTQYHRGMATLANTLLLPFRTSKNEPVPEIRDRILDIVLERIGDPRTRADRWLHMEEAAEIACRWLTRVALMQFLEIVDQVAYPMHWNYRRAFWTALHDKGAISEAWVAFGPEGSQRAKRDYGKNARFGRLVSGWKPVESGHAVLVMRIGDYIAIDWSHNGRCIFWPANDLQAPKLYESEYLSGDIAPRVAPAGGIEKSHSGSVSYSWQREIADFIRRRTGFKLRDRDYHVI